MTHLSTKDAVVVLTLLTIPLPAIYSFNQFLATHTLDALHYILFQLLFLALAPLYQVGLLRKAKNSAKEDTRLVTMNRNIEQDSYTNSKTIASTKTHTNELCAGIEKQQDENKKSESTLVKLQPKTGESINTVTPKHPYIQECEAMTGRFTSLIDEDADAPGSPWVIMVNQLQPSFLKIYKHKEADFCYKIIATADNTSETAFDLLSDVTKRPEWDDLCDSTRIIEELDTATRIQYVKMKPIWPTSARDTVLLSFVKQLEDGRYLNVTKSVVHQQCPEMVNQGIVRMEAGLAGQVVGPEPGYPNKCRIIQIVDGDPKGWIPKSVIKFVATTALPKSFRQLNQKLSAIPPEIVSRVISVSKSASCTSHDKEDTPQLSAKHNQFSSNRLPIELSASVKLDEILARVSKLEQQLTLLTSGVQFRILNASSALRTLRGILNFLSPFMITGMFFHLLKRYGAKKLLNRSSR